jgi:exonuclease III
VRGLGGLEKRKEVRLLVAEKRPHILCLQETKLTGCDVSVSSSLWGSPDHDYSFRPSVGASGGLLMMWDCSEVEVWSSMSQDHILIIHGRFIRTDEEFYLFNVYAPCDARAKLELWESLTTRLHILRGQKVCVCGDFNTVCGVEE